MNTLSTCLFLRSLHELAALVETRRRLPHLGDRRPPWTYRGFLLPYVIQLHSIHPEIPNRWEYHFHTIECGLLHDPIPQLSFCHFPDHATLRQIERWIRLIEETSSGGSSFHSLIEWMAWAFGVSDNQPTLDDSLQQKLYRMVNVEPWFCHPYDYFGDILAEQRSRGWNTTGFFPTPHAVCEMMTQMMVNGAETSNGHDPRTRSIMDPCCGTGRMLLHASNYSLNLHGMDIDPLVLTITKINGALYCPWLPFPFPSRIFKRDLVTESKGSLNGALSEPLPKVASNDQRVTSETKLTFQF